MRITRVYTGTGDLGETRLGDGSKVPKDHPRIITYGEIDLANSVIGEARSAIDDLELDTILADIQHRLFDLSGTLCVPGEARADLMEFLRDRTQRFEQQMDQWFELQGPLEEFILPGGSPGASRLHLARCHIRRAEQFLVSLNRQEPIQPEVMQYMNRLSDLLFVMAREANRRVGVRDVTWKPTEKKKG